MPFQAIKTRKTDLEAKKNPVLHLYDVAGGKAHRQPSDPDVVICMDEFGPLNLQPYPGKQWTVTGGRVVAARRRRRATYTRTCGVRHLFACYDLSCDRVYGHIKARRDAPSSLPSARYMRSLYPKDIRIAIVLDNFSPAPLDQLRPAGRRVGCRQQRRTRQCADQRQLAQPDRGALRRSSLLHARWHRPRDPHRAARRIRRYIAWRNYHAQDDELCEVVKHATVA